MKNTSKKKDKNHTIKESVKDGNSIGNHKKRIGKGKKILYIFIAIIFILIFKYLFGCALKVPVSTEHINDIQIDEKMVEVNVKKENLSRTNLTLEIKNNTDMYLLLGDDEVEYKMFGGWYRMVPKRVFVSNLVTKPIAPWETFEINYSWKNEFGRLSFGEYRLVVDAHFGATSEEQEENNSFIQRRDLYLSYEFSCGIFSIKASNS